MRTKKGQEAPITIDGSEKEDINEEVYLDSKMSQAEVKDNDIKSIITKACQVFANLRSVWRTTVISTITKLKILSIQLKCEIITSLWVRDTESPFIYLFKDSNLHQQMSPVSNLSGSTKY